LIIRLDATSDEGSPIFCLRGCDADSPSSTTFTRELYKLRLHRTAFTLATLDFTATPLECRGYCRVTFTELLIISVSRISLRINLALFTELLSWLIEFTRRACRPSRPPRALSDDLFIYQPIAAPFTTTTSNSIKSRVTKHQKAMPPLPPLAWPEQRLRYYLRRHFCYAY